MDLTSIESWDSVGKYLQTLDANPRAFVPAAERKVAPSVRGIRREVLNVYLHDSNAFPAKGFTSIFFKLIKQSKSLKSLFMRLRYGFGGTQDLLLISDIREGGGGSSSSEELGLESCMFVNIQLNKAICQQLGKALRSACSMQKLELMISCPEAAGLQALCKELQAGAISAAPPKRGRKSGKSASSGAGASAHEVQPCSLRELSLQGNPDALKGAGAKALAALLASPLCPLSKIDVVGCSLSGISLSQLAEGMREQFEQHEEDQGEEACAGVRLQSFEATEIQPEKDGARGKSSKSVYALADALSHPSCSLAELHLRFASPLGPGSSRALGQAMRENRSLKELIATADGNAGMTEAMLQAAAGGQLEKLQLEGAVAGPSTSAILRRVMLGDAAEPAAAAAASSKAAKSVKSKAKKGRGKRSAASSSAASAASSGPATASPPAGACGNPTLKVLRLSMAQGGHAETVGARTLAEQAAAAVAEAAAALDPACFSLRQLELCAAPLSKTALQSITRMLQAQQISGLAPLDSGPHPSDANTEAVRQAQLRGEKLPSFILDAFQSVARGRVESQERAERTAALARAAQARARAGEGPGSIPAGLRALKFLACSVEDSDYDALHQMCGAMRGHRSLDELAILGMPTLGDEGVRVICEAAYSNETMLNMWNDVANRVGERPMGLRRLELLQAGVTEIGARRLALLLRATRSLEHLNLGRNKIGTHGGMALGLAVVDPTLPAPDELSYALYDSDRCEQGTHGVLCEGHLAGTWMEQYDVAIPESELINEDMLQFDVDLDADDDDFGYGWGSGGGWRKKKKKKMRPEWPPIRELRGPFPNGTGRPNRSLRWLRLGLCMLPDEGAHPVLFAMARNQSIVELDLSFCGFDVEESEGQNGEDLALIMYHNQSIRVLDYSGDPNSEGASRLEKTLKESNCGVSWLRDDFGMPGNSPPSVVPPRDTESVAVKLLGKVVTPSKVAGHVPPGARTKLSAACALLHQASSGNTTMPAINIARWVAAVLRTHVANCQGVLADRLIPLLQALLDATASEGNVPVLPEHWELQTTRGLHRSFPIRALQLGGVVDAVRSIGATSGAGKGAASATASSSSGMAARGAASTSFGKVSWRAAELRDRVLALAGSDVAADSDESDDEEEDDDDGPATAGRKRSRARGRGSTKRSRVGSR